MKINPLDAHDRYTHFTKKAFDISECCQDLIDKRPFGDHPFYIFAHKREIGVDERFKLFSSGHYRTIEEVPTHTIIWQPRLTKPKAQTNSMLFKAYPGSDNIKVIWMIPDPCLWEQFESGKLTESKVVAESIYDYKHNKERMEAKEDDDLSDEVIDQIYREISLDARRQNAVSSQAASLTPVYNPQSQNQDEPFQKVP